MPYQNISWHFWQRFTSCTDWTRWQKTRFISKCKLHWVLLYRHLLCTVFFKRVGKNGIHSSHLKEVWKSESVTHSVMSNSFLPHRLYPTRLLHPWDSPGRNTGVSSHPTLQDIFPTQGLNPCLSHDRQIFFHWSHHARCLHVS